MTTPARFDRVPIAIDIAGQYKAIRRWVFVEVNLKVIGRHFMIDQDICC